MLSRISFTCCISLFLTAQISAADTPRPAVLFYGGVHPGYVARPLHDMGIEVDSCNDDTAELTARLATGKFNVVVTSTLKDADRAALDAFMARGGAVLACQ